jgi:hypothetical protein
MLSGAVAFEQQIDVYQGTPDEHIQVCGTVENRPAAGKITGRIEVGFARP